MGIGDTFSFDQTAYYWKHCDMSNDVLERKHSKKVMQTTASSFGVGAGIGLAIFTGGLSLAGSVYSARQADVINEQIYIIEGILAQRGRPIPRRRLRDELAGGAIGVASFGAGLGLNPVSKELRALHSLTDVPLVRRPYGLRSWLRSFYLHRQRLVNCDTDSCTACCL
jgi:hypothetical protein